LDVELCPNGQTKKPISSPPGGLCRDGQRDEIMRSSTSCKIIHPSQYYYGCSGLNFIGLTKPNCDFKIFF